MEDLGRGITGRKFVTRVVENVVVGLLEVVGGGGRVVVAGRKACKASRQGKHAAKQPSSQRGRERGLGRNVLSVEIRVR